MTRLLLVASSGGHLDELRLMVDVLGLQSHHRTWVTTANDHSTAVLGDEDVRWVAPVGSRDLVAAVRALPVAVGHHRRVAPDLVVSTGAALAVPYLVASRAARCPTWYVESVTRRDGPSLTGKLAATLPGLRTMAQGFSNARWEGVEDVFARYRVVARPTPRPVDDVLVTLGQEKFPFDRAVVAVRRAARDATVRWQLGTTSAAVEGARAWVPGSDLRAEADQCDAIICHAGVGSILMALAAGKVPVVLPRRVCYGEHVDDHQREIATELGERGLVVNADPDELDTADLVRAAGLDVVLA